MLISVLTPTANRPVAFGLAERWFSQQTRRADEWIVVDGGQDPLRCTLRQRHIRNPGPPGRDNFLSNLEVGILTAAGDLIVVWEDDDYYQPGHLHAITDLFDDNSLIAGDDQQRYYNLPHRCWRVFDNIGASLCQTAFRRALVPVLLDQIAVCRKRQSYGLDRIVWEAVPRSAWTLRRLGTVVGMKGLTGEPGLGIGHRPTGPQWTADADGAILREWVGADAETYERLSLGV